MCVKERKRVVDIKREREIKDMRKGAERERETKGEI